MILVFDVRPVASVFLAAVLAIGGLAPSTGAALAQSASTSQSGAALLKAGLDAQKARNHAAAISLLSRAINSGALPRKQMTYALYRRAISNRAQRQAAQAISDLNSALFFKDGLSSRDRADAIEERMRAFRDAGLKPTSVATASSASQWTPSATVPTRAAQPPQSRVVSTAPRRVLEPIKVSKPVGSSATLPQGAPILAPTPAATTAPPAARDLAPFRTRVAAVPAKPVSRATRTSSFSSFLTPKVERGVGVPKQAKNSKKAKRPAAPTTPWQVATKHQPAPVALKPVTLSQGTVTVKPAEQPVAKPTPAAASTGTGVGQFFSSLFGGSSSAPPTSTQVTGSLEPAQVAPKVDPSAKPVRVAATGPAASAKPAPVTTVRPAAAANAVPVTNIQPATAVRPSRPTGPGKFEIEVAQLRDKYRAEALAKQLVVQYSRSSFWSPRQTARVHEKPAAGEEGSVYSVRYGVYSSKAALSSMCDRLKAGGLDCEPVRQN